VNRVRKRAIEELRRMVLDALADHDAAVWLFGSCAQGRLAEAEAALASCAGRPLRLRQP
jgi:hypothetical protein